MMLVGLLLFALVLGAVLLASVWLTNLALRKLVGDKHRALEEIVNTGQVPRTWSDPYEAEIARLRETPGNDTAIANLRARGTTQSLKKLDSLERYVETSHLIGDSDARELLLDKLSAARAAAQTRTTVR
jgi:hypothetical protein